MKVQVLGSGGAFDVAEGNSSFVVTMNDKNYLVDCGEDVFSKLIKENLADKIDYICITHNHSDHIGSLSSYLFYCCYVLKKTVPIITSPSVDSDLMNILSNMGMRYGTHYKILNVHKGIRVLPTDNLHDNNLPSCGFCFDNKLIISGDIGKSLLDVNRDIAKLVENGAILFHDCATFESPVHCHFGQFLKYEKKILNNIYFYHHNLVARDKLTVEHKFQVVHTGQKLSWDQ